MPIQMVDVTDIQMRVSNGKSKPFICNCKKENGEVFTGYLKMVCMEESLTVEEIQREIIANFLAELLQLRCCSGFISKLDREILEEYQSFNNVDDIDINNLPEFIYGFVSQSLGQQFTSWQVDEKYPQSLKQAYLDAYLFDVITGNLDRKIGNPNTLVNADGEFMLIDFGYCFQEYFREKVDSWKNDIYWNSSVGNSQSIFYKYIHEKVDLDEIEASADKWRNLNIEKFSENCDKVSVTGDLSWFSSVEAYLNYLVDNSDEFVIKANLNINRKIT